MNNTCIPEETVADIKKRAREGKITAEEVTKMLPEEREALKHALEDFVAEKMGVTVTEAEVKGINERAQKIDKAQEKLGDNFGNPEYMQDNIDFFKAKKEMDDYLQELAPANRLKIATGTIGRGVMLTSVKSPLLNIGSNIEIGVTEALARRLSGGGVFGANNALAKSFIKMAYKIYQESGYDISRMTTLRDSGRGGERVLGETVHSQGKGAIRKIGRFFEDKIFKQLMGAPDVAFSSAHFADSVNTGAMKMAKGDKVAATEMMHDAMRLEPKTLEGQALRDQGIADAQVATWTDSSWASKVSEGIRKVLNDVSGDVRAGDYLLPFIKTPANVIATGMDYAGAGIPKALFKTIKAFRDGKLEGLKSPEYTRSVARDLVRSGIGLTAAMIIVNQLDESEFVGAYDPSRAQIEQLRGTNYNAIKVGDKWISVDWLGPLAVPVTAGMYAKKYGNTAGEKSFQYSKGVAGAALNIPGVSDLVDTVRGQVYKKNQDLNEMTDEAKNYVLNEIASRIIPSIFADTAKASDKFDRNTKGSTAGIPNSIINKLPIARQTLPVKKDIFGNEVVGESALSDILFGARVKTDKETALIKEISDVSSATEKGITFTDWEKSSSKTLKQFHEKVGDERFNKAKLQYGKELQKELEQTIKNPAYKKLSDDEKLKVLAGKDTDAMNLIFKKNGFHYKPEKSKIPKSL